MKLLSMCFVVFACGFPVEEAALSGERPANLLVSNAVEKAPTIEEPALSRPDEYKAHFIKQGKRGNG